MSVLPTVVMLDVVVTLDVVVVVVLEVDLFDVVMVLDVVVVAVTYESVRGQSHHSGAVRLFYMNVSIGFTDRSLMYLLSYSN